MKANQPDSRKKITRLASFAGQAKQVIAIVNTIIVIVKFILENNWM